MTSRRRTEISGVLKNIKAGFKKAATCKNSKRRGAEGDKAQNRKEWIFMKRNSAKCLKTSFPSTARNNNNELIYSFIKYIYIHTCMHSRYFLKKIT